MTRPHTGAARQALVEVLDHLDYGASFQEAVRWQREVLVLALGRAHPAVQAFDAATTDEATARRALRDVPLSRFAWQAGDVQVQRKGGRR